MFTTVAFTDADSEVTVAAEADPPTTSVKPVTITKELSNAAISPRVDAFLLKMTTPSTKST